MQMSAEMLAAFKEEIDDASRGWKATSVHEQVAQRLTLDGLDLVEVSERHVTLTVQSDVKGTAIIFMLEGPASGALTSGKAVIYGTAFDFTDAELLTKLSNAANAAAEANASSVLGGLFGPVEAQA